MNKSSPANKEIPQLPSIPALMEALIAMKMPWNKEVADKVGFCFTQPPTKDDETKFEETTSPDCICFQTTSTLTLKDGRSLTQEMQLLLFECSSIAIPRSEHSEQYSMTIPIQYEGHVTDMEDNR
ncbi:hypothetical protein Tco_0917628 [Tanacetum coccineum]